jgi:hypothetical protein
LERRGIIEKVKGPAKWASPLVVVPKPNGDIRLCTDNNIYILAVIDYYSRWIEIDILKSITSSKIVQSLDRMFLTHGLPCELTSDNDPQFVFSEFEEFCEKNGIYHRRITPLWPRQMRKTDEKSKQSN